MPEASAEVIRETVLRPRRGFNAIPVAEIWHFRDLLLTLAQRDVKLRYRQTALGVAWVVLQPLIGAGLFSFVFGSIAKLPSQGIPYFVFSYVGLAGWTVFANTLSKASTSLIGNANLVSKVYFPRLILPFSCGFAILLDYAVSLVMMFVLLAAYHIPLTAAILALPLLLAATLTLAMGLGLVAAALMVSYRDVNYLLPVFTQFLLYASPVAYSSDLVPRKAQAIFAFNPIVGLMDGYRWSCLGVPIANWGPLIYSLAFALVSLFVGAIVFQRMERRFADVI